MTFAPQTIKNVRTLLKGEDSDLSDEELGIVGGPSHVLKGTSYHLGADQLKMSKNPYSARTARDKAGLSNAASALDVDDDLDELRALSVWMVGQCRSGAADTLDIREIIYSPDGVQVLCWDRERGMTSLPVPDSDLSHRTHTHFDWYRDSEFRDKTGPFRRFFMERSGSTMATDAYVLLDSLTRVQGNNTFTPAGEDGVRYGSLSNAMAVAAIQRSARDARLAADGVAEVLRKLDQLLAQPPGVVDLALIRRVVREELDATQWGSIE